MNQLQATEKSYGFLWRKSKGGLAVPKWHFDFVQEALSEPIVRGKRGIDVGSGCGYDTYIMAKDNPKVKIVSIDLSDGVYQTKRLVANMSNVGIIKCSVLDMPIKNNIFDFAYSFGVLHHTDNPKKGLLEINRVLKKKAPAFLYLYENHSENYVKYIAVKIINKLRKVTVRLPSGLLYALSYIFSPLVFIIFSLPSKILSRFKFTQHFTKKIPFNFGRGPFSLRGDLYDRFSVLIEYRFSKQEVYNLFNECGFEDINITKIDDRAGWVVWGYKKQDENN